MGTRFNLVLNQITKACEFIGTLIASPKINFKQESEIDQNLAELTGFDLEFFSESKNAAALPSVLLMIEDDNKRAVAAILLLFKNEALYRERSLAVLSGLDPQKLHANVRHLIEQIVG